MEIDSIIQIIGNVGFPIAITVYLLQHFGKKIESLDSSIQTLSNTIANIRNGKG